MTVRPRTLRLIQAADEMMADPDDMAKRRAFVSLAFNVDKLAESIVLLATDSAELALRRNAR